MKELGFGELYGLVVSDGRPQLGPDVRVRQSSLLGAPKSTGLNSRDGLTDRRFKDLIAYCADHRDFVISRLTVQDGLPHRIERDGSFRNH